MTIIQILVIIFVIGVLLGLINRFAGEWINGQVLKLLNAVVIGGIVIWLLLMLLRAFGISSGV